MKLAVTLLLILFTSTAFSAPYSFKDAVMKISSHELIQSIQQKSKALNEEGSQEGSWGDPVFKIAAKNFPKESLKDDESAMTGIEFVISKKIALTTKYGNTEEAFIQLGNAKDLDANTKKNEMLKFLWSILIDNRKLTEQVSINKS